MAIEKQKTIVSQNEIVEGEGVALEETTRQMIYAEMKQGLRDREDARRSQRFLSSC